MKLKYQWQATTRGNDVFADVADHVRLRVRRRAARSPFFYGMLNGEFCGMWKDRERAKAAMERIYEQTTARVRNDQQARVE